MANFTSVADRDWSDQSAWHQTFNVESLDNATSSIVVDGDVTSDIASGQQIDLEGCVDSFNNGIKNVIGVSYDSGGGVSTIQIDTTLGNQVIPQGYVQGVSIPSTGDHAEVRNHLTLDIQIAALANLTVTQAGYMGELIQGAGLHVDAFANMGSVPITLVGNGHLTDITTAVSISGSGTLNNVQMQGGNLTIGGGDTLSFNGRMDGGTIELFGALNGNDLVLGDIDHVDCTDGTFQGNIVFEQSTEMDNNSNSISFIGNGDKAIVFKQGLDLSQFTGGVDFEGLIKTYNQLYLPNGPISADGTIYLMTKAADLVIGSGVVVQYNGPAGGAMGNFSLSL